MTEPARSVYRLARSATIDRRLPSDVRLRTITDADDHALATLMERAYAGTVDEQFGGNSDGVVEMAASSSGLPTRRSGLTATVTRPTANAGDGMPAAELFDVSGSAGVVTGGASGIGLGYVEALAENGGRVTILDIDGEATEREVLRLRGAGLDVRGGRVDVTDHAALDTAIDEAAATYGRLDVVFANVGVDPGPGFVGAWAGSTRPRNDDGALEHYTTERWERAIDINLTGIFATMRAAARHMRPQRSGRIIVTTSVASTKNEAVIGAAYMAAKAGAAHLMRNVALELAAYGITVNAIAPGWFVTNIGDGHAHNPEEQAAVAREIPMHRVGWPADIKGLALFLASPASAYITGQEIVIDGGWRLGIAD